jgi:DNA-binding MarR family transcriptional regulator
MTDGPDASAALASELRVAVGHLIRRLRAEHAFSLAQGSVLGRLDRGGPQAIGVLATAERVRPQSMAQTVRELEASGYVDRGDDPLDARKVIVSLTAAGREVLEADRRHREGWLADALQHDLDDRERAIIHEAAPLLQRLAGV